MILKQRSYVIRSMRTEIKTKLSNVTDKSNVAPCLTFFQGFVLTGFWKELVVLF